MPTPNAKNHVSTFLAPDRLYSLPGFEQASGLGRETRRKARLEGIQLATFRVGKRKFVRGSDAIEYVCKLANAARPENAEPSLN